MIALQSIKMELSPFFILHNCIAIYLNWSYLPLKNYNLWLHCNLLNWSYLPFNFFCVIALQSIKLELLPFFICSRLHCNLLKWSCLVFKKNCVIALQSIKLGLPPILKKFVQFHCNLLNWSCLPFFILRDCIAIY